MISLAPLNRDQSGRVAHLALKPDQTNFTQPVLDTLRDAESTRDFHIILEQDDIVGFFSIDVNYKDQYDFTIEGDIGLYSFQIGQKFQGRGIASQAARCLKTYLAARYPEAKSVVLTVNCKKPAAYACYISGGFSDTKTKYLLGDAGPQHILRLVFLTKPHA